MMWLKPSEGIRKALWTGLVLAAATVGLTACGNDGCTETREAYCVAEFEAQTGATVASLYVWGIGQQLGHATRIDSVFSWQADTQTWDTVVTETPLVVDSLMAGITSSPETLELLLRPDTTATQLRLLWLATVGESTAQYVDTITLRYEAHPYFIDMDCGCTIRYHLQEAVSTQHFMQSVSIIHNDITNEAHPNLHIVY